MKVLFIGDVFGESGMKALQKYLPGLKIDHKPNMIFLNGENVNKGHGISKKQYKEIMRTTTIMKCNICALSVIATSLACIAFPRNVGINCSIVDT